MNPGEWAILRRRVTQTQLSMLDAAIKLAFTVATVSKLDGYDTLDIHREIAAIATSCEHLDKMLKGMIE